MTMNALDAPQNIFQVNLRTENTRTERVLKGDDSSTSLSTCIGAEKHRKIGLKRILKSWQIFVRIAIEPATITETSIRETKQKLGSIVICANGGPKHDATDATNIASLFGRHARTC